MDELVQKIGWKKLSIILIAVSIIGIIFVISSFSSGDRQAIDQAKNKALNYDSNSSSSKKDSSDIITKQIEGERHYVTPFYEVSYPENFNPVNYEAPNGILSSVKLTSEDAREVAIVVYPYSDAVSLATLSEPYKKYKRQARTINSFDAVEFVSDIVTLRFHERVTIIMKDEGFVRISATYGGSQDDYFDEEYRQIVESIK